MLGKVGFEDVLAVCHQAVWDAECWPNVLGVLAAYLDNEAITLESFGAGYESVIDFQSHGVDAPAVARYMEYFQSRNPRHDVVKSSSIGQSNYDLKILSEYQINKDEFYQELLRPLGLKYFLSNTLLKSTDNLVLLAQHIPNTGQHVDAAQVNRLEKIAPFIAQSYRLSQEFLQLRGRLSMSKEIIDSMGIGLVILDSNGAMTFCTHQAETLLSDHTIANQNKPGIQLRHRRSNLLLQSAIGKTLAQTLSEPIPPLYLTDADNQISVRLDILPINSDSTLSAEFKVASNQRKVAVLVKDMNPGGTLPETVLREVFSLTTKEINLSKSLIDGLSLKQHADCNAVKLSTVRSQYASLRAKLGARTEADVLRVLFPLIIQ